MFYLLLIKIIIHQVLIIIIMSLQTLWHHLHVQLLPLKLLYRIYSHQLSFPTSFLLYHLCSLCFLIKNPFLNVFTLFKLSFYLHLTLLYVLLIYINSYYNIYILLLQIIIHLHNLHLKFANFIKVQRLIPSAFDDL